VIVKKSPGRAPRQFRCLDIPAPDRGNKNHCPEPKVARVVSEGALPVAAPVTRTAVFRMWPDSASCSALSPSEKRSARGR
jgi:hypothetical protein